MNLVWNYLILPKAVTAFERTYLARVNRVGVVFFATHLLILPLIAWVNGTGPVLVAALTASVFAGPLFAWWYATNPRHVSIVHGVASMGMGAILVHAGQGPIQIEMHFYFFVLLALLAVYANPLAILAAAGTVAVHHAVFWLLLPQSVFNYDAPWWVVGVHALFVVLESAAAISIARGFFDNVVGLEQIVQARTAALDNRNREVRLMLDNAGQGFLMIDRDGRVGAEQAAVLSTWFGPIPAGERWADVLARFDAKAGLSFELGWEAVLEDVLPLDLAVDQLPRRLRGGEQTFSFGYTPLLADGVIHRALVIVTDISAEVHRETMEAEQRQILAAFERLSKDKAGFLEFWTDGERLLQEALHGGLDLPSTLRAVHTLKGNAALFGLDSISAACHFYEDQVAEVGQASADPIRVAWDRLAESLHVWLNERSGIEVEDEEFEAILLDLTGDTPRDRVAARIAAWRLEPASRRLQRFADQAEQTAKRLGKEYVVVDVDADPVRLDARVLGDLWSAWTHLLRNALDHGVESAEERHAAGKPERAKLRLTADVVGGALVLGVHDDGAGIDWEQVRSKAAQKGLPAVTQTDLENALFRDGFSTRDHATAMSGRGVGLAAVASAVRDLEGTISIESTPGKGTSFLITVPKSEAWVDTRTFRLAA
jgi:signal transduction histidine kinase